MHRSRCTLSVFFLAVALCLAFVGHTIDSGRTKGHDGFWHISQDTRGVWWYVSPEGEKEFLVTVQNVNPTQPAIDPSKGFYLSKDYKGDLDQWAHRTAERVRAYGFKGFGAWSSKSLRSQGPYEQDLNVMKWCGHRITDPEWPAEVDAIVRRQVSPDDKNLIGYYLDNELDWSSLEPYAERYFSVVAGAVRAHDPNHLILGVRFNKRPPVGVLKASKGWVDAHSFNQYSDDAVLQKTALREAALICGVPVIVSEFSFYSSDNRSGTANTRGFGGEVSDQTERAKGFRKIVLGAAETNFVVGVSWFQWMDEPPSGRLLAGDHNYGEDCNYGIVDTGDGAYLKLVASSIEANRLVNSVHVGSDSSQSGEVWKDETHLAVASSSVK